MGRKKINTPAKMKQYYHRYYLAHKGEYIARANARRMRQGVETAAMIDAAKSKPCADCGVQYPPYVMQFDHVRGVKEFGIARGRNGCWSSKRLLDEIAKCEVVCANCHAERTQVTKKRMSRYARHDDQMMLPLQPPAP